MREITKYHDTSKTVKERAKTKVFGAVYSHTAIILLRFFFRLALWFSLLHIWEITVPI